MFFVCCSSACSPVSSGLEVLDYSPGGDYIDEAGVQFRFCSALKRVVPTNLRETSSGPGEMILLSSFPLCLSEISSVLHHVICSPSTN